MIKEPRMNTNGDEAEFIGVDSCHLVVKKEYERVDRTRFAQGIALPSRARLKYGARQALKEAELIRCRQFEAMVVRSETKVTRKVSGAPKLRVVVEPAWHRQRGRGRRTEPAWCHEHPGGTR